jgi:hypothetical protein
MAVQITASLPIDSADLLVGYGAGAKVYLYSSATEAGAYALVTSVAIVSGTESYEIWDSAGSDTTWYKSRIGDATATTFSEYSDPFQVGAQEGYTSLVRVKRHLKVTNTADDAYILDCVDSANAWLTAEVGRFYGPSADTSRSFDVERDSKTLMIGGGVRTVTTLEVRLQEGGTLYTVPAADYVLRPPAWDLLPGLTYDRIEFVDLPTGGYDRFHAGRNMAVVTSTTFGPEVPPLALTRIADTIAVWMFQSRAAGMGGVVGSLETGELVVNRVLTGADIRTIRLYRGVGPSLYAMPAF